MDPKTTRAAVSASPGGMGGIQRGREEDVLVPLLPPPPPQAEDTPAFVVVEAEAREVVAPAVAVVAADEEEEGDPYSTTLEDETSAAAASAGSVRSFLATNFNLLAIGIVAAIMILAYCTTGGTSTSHCLVASGPIIKREYTMSLFNKLETDLPGKVTIVQADKQYVMVESNANVLDKLSTNIQNNGEWKIRLENGRCVTKLHTLNVYIETPNLDSITSKGSGDLEAMFHADSDDVKKNKTISLFGSGDMKVSYSNLNVLTTKTLGSGTLTLEGDCQVHNLRTLGSGDVNSFKFDSQHTTIGMVGSGDVNVKVNRTLEVTMIGSGDVRYMGNPTVTKSGFGSGDVKQVN